jgi:hypothetical protein
MLQTSLAIMDAMKSTLTSIPLLLLASIVIVAYSISLDWGSTTWTWFQRSGSLLALAGAVMGYRSIVRLGVDGVGAACPTAVKVKLVSVDDSGPRQSAKIAYDHSTITQYQQAAIDRLAGYVGACLIIVGTVVAGYGDFLGCLF